LDRSEVKAKYQHFLAEAGDILIATSGSLGKMAMVREEDLPVMLNTSIMRFRPHDPAVLDPRFAYWFLKSDMFLLQAHAAATGSAQLNFGPSHLRGFVIPFPRPAEQRRIAVRLDRLCGRSKSAREDLAHIPRLVERYKQAILAAVMETDGAGGAWPRVSLEELLTEGPTNGYSPRSGENPTGTLSLKLTATTRGVMDLSDRAVKRLNEVVPKDSKFWLRAGDILIQRANSLEYVGMAAIYDGPPHKYIYPDLMIRIRVASPTVGRWIWRYCSSASGRRYFTSNATGTAGNMPKINGSTIREMQIPFPPLSQLETLLGRIDRALRAIDALDVEAGRAQKLLERLDHSTLDKAFRGDLVTGP
jgi:type I restriction enzyme S subunit